MPVLELEPKTCADNFYALGGEKPSSMRLLANFVPAPDSASQWVPRPAATLLPGSDVFAPGFVSCQLVVGSRVYGMVSSALHAGKDQPFCYDLVTQALVSISGITNGNSPTSPSATGAWVTPHMELIGVNIIVTHSGFSGSAGVFFGVLNTSNPASLTWASANTATNLLPSVPVWVSQFGGRAYYFCNPAGFQPAVLATDVLDALTITNGSYVLTFGDNVPLLCGGPLTYNSQLVGIIQALIVFKAGAVNMFQVTGDFALQTTAINSLNVATGTLAPNSITTTPKGLMFVAPDGLRLIDFSGAVSDPIGIAGTGVSVPFIASTVPSRIAAASNATTIRMSTQNGATTNNAQQEWCFDFTRGAWYGPHTFPISLISEFGNSFIVSAIGLKGLWQSDIIPNASSTYVENGATYTCTYQSGNMPERAGVMELNSVKAVLYQGAGIGTSTFDCIAFDDANNILDTVGLSFFSTTVSWDHFTWGSGVLLGSSQALSALEIPWGFPLVFDHMSIYISTIAAAGVRLGKFLMEYNQTGYTVKGPLSGAVTYTTPPPVPIPALPPPPPPPPSIDPGLPGLLACMGSQPSPVRQTLINSTLIALRAAGLLAKLDILYVFAMEASNQALCNWINPGTFDATISGSPTFTASQGFNSAGGSSLSTNFTPSTNGINFQLNSASVFAWTGSVANSASQLISDSNITMIISTIGTNTQTRLNSGFIIGAIPSGVPNGMLTLSRQSSTGYIAYNNNTVVDTLVNVSTSLDATPIIMSTATDKIISMAGAGGYLSPADISALQSIFSTYFTAVGCPQ